MPGFSGSHILPSEKEETLDLKTFSQIRTAMKKLQWIPNIKMKPSIQYFGNVYISNDIEKYVFNHRLWNKDQCY